MPADGIYHQDGRSDAEAVTASRRVVSDRSLVVRNYDGSETHEVCVRFVDADGDVAFRRSFRVVPMETVVVETRIERAVYRVEARLDDGEADSAECLIGSGVDETALVETGNGTVSVVEGFA